MAYTRECGEDITLAEGNGQYDEGGVETAEEMDMSDGGLQGRYRRGGGCMSTHMGSEASVLCQVICSGS